MNDRSFLKYLSTNFVICSIYLDFIAYGGVAFYGRKSPQSGTSK